MVSHLTYPEALVVGLIQGATELFPLSSLGHNVLIPALVGGRWAQDLNVSKPKSPYLAFIVGMHVATAIAMIIYFWRDWLRIIGAFFTSVWHRRVRTPDERLAWLVIVATIPVGITGLALEHIFRVALARPVPTAIFLAVNGIVLLAGERLWRREKNQSRRGETPNRGVPAPPAGLDPHPATAPGGQLIAGDGGTLPATAPLTTAGRAAPRSRAGAATAGAPLAGRHPGGHHAIRQQQLAEAIAADRRLSRVSYRQAIILGIIQSFALLPGISRDGIVMVGGMARGLTRQDAARFSFLLSAPVILAAGALKIPDLMGPPGDGIRGQVLAGSVVSGIGAYIALRVFVRLLQKPTRVLTPFAIYCLAAGIGSAIYLGLGA